jgi:hypothetical protein
MRVGDQGHSPAALTAGNKPGDKRTGGRMDPRAGLDEFGKSLPQTGLDPRTLQNRGVSLCRLSYRGPRNFMTADTKFKGRNSVAR